MGFPAVNQVETISTGGGPAFLFDLDGPAPIITRDLVRHAHSIGLRSGGYGGDELRDAGAYRIYDDPADILAHLDEVGFRST